jgi:hypothetical protein
MLGWHIAHKDLFLSSEAAMLTEPDFVIVGIEVSIVDAHILISAEGNEPCLGLGNPGHLATDRAFFLHHKGIFAHQKNLPSIKFSPP